MSRSESVLASLATTALTVALVVLPLRLDPQGLPRDLAAHALDFFGSDDDEEKVAEPFWVEGSDGITPTPVGLPDFASLAERVSPAVVNVKAERTVRTGGDPRLPRGMEEFFGNPFGTSGQPAASIRQGVRLKYPRIGLGFEESADTRTRVRLTPFSVCPRAVSFRYRSIPSIPH